MGSYQGVGMNLFRSIFILKLCVLLALPFNTWSQALPVAQPTNVNRAVAGATNISLVRRGYAANDPRFLNTAVRMSNVAAGAAGTAAAVVAGTVTAPAWASVALAIGVGTVVSYAINLALDSFVKWYFRNDGKIDDSSDGTAPSSTAVLVFGGTYWSATPPGLGNASLIGADGSALAKQSFALRNPGYVANPLYPLTITVTPTNIDYSGANRSAAWLMTNGSPVNCPAGSYYINGACTGYSYVDQPLPTTLGNTPQQAVNHIPASESQKKLNPAILAAIANREWAQASAQPGYDGLPYNAADPVTSQDVASWTSQNPTYAPSIADFTAPMPTTTSNPTPWALPQNPTSAVTTPATTPNQGTINPGASNPLENLGIDPATPSPSLENIPTAQQILNPVLSLVPSLKGFNATTPSGVCPQPSINLFNKTQTFTAHCTIFENNKATMQAAMTFAWALLAVLIILSA
jgi:hypothetical protein